MESLIHERVSVSLGSISGREHRRTRRNNQDGVSVSVSDGLIVAAVTDGCSSGRFSEVGALLGARWLSRWIPEGWDPAIPLPQLIAWIEAGLLQFLETLASALSPDLESAWEIVKEYLLFTWMVAVIDPERSVIFGIGDGVWSVNGQVTRLDAGVSNAPPYLAYRLVPDRVEEMEAADLRTAVHVAMPTPFVRSLIVGSDGLNDLLDGAKRTLKDGSLQGGLEQFERDPRYARNPSLLQKRLAVIGDLNGRLRDDTTMVFIRGEG